MPNLSGELAGICDFKLVQIVDIADTKRMKEANNRPVCDGSPAAGQPSDLSQHNTHNSPASTGQ